MPFDPHVLVGFLALVAALIVVVVDDMVADFKRERRERKARRKRKHLGIKNDYDDDGMSGGFYGGL